MRFVVLIATTFLLAGPILAGGPQLDLTGRWIGELKCTGYDVDGKGKFFDFAELLISQQGDLLFIDWLSFPEGDLLGGYDGIAVSDPRNARQKGTVSLVECETDFDQSSGYAEMSLLNAKIDRDRIRGALKGEGTFNDVDSDMIGECKWKFTLISRNDPGAIGCFGE